MMKKFNRITKINIILVALLVTALGACKVEKKGSYKNEAARDISGTWKIKSASVNGTDLRTLVPDEIDNFRVNFTKDYKFTLTNPIPFLALKDGVYSFDDPITPFLITLTGEGLEPASTAFSYSVNPAAARNITMAFSSGCSLNKYIYTLEKVN